MNEAERATIREAVLAGPDDLVLQLEWYQESLKAHERIEQRLKAQFRVMDFAGDDIQMRKIQADIQEVRAAVGFIQAEIARIEQALKG